MIPVRAGGLGVLAVGVVVAVVLGLAFVAVVWAAIKKTVSMIKAMVMFGVFAVTLSVFAAAIAFAIGFGMGG